MLERRPFFLIVPSHHIPAWVITLGPVVLFMSVAMLDQSIEGDGFLVSLERVLTVDAAVIILLDDLLADPCAEGMFPMEFQFVPDGAFVGKLRQGDVLHMIVYE